MFSMNSNLRLKVYIHIVYCRQKYSAEKANGSQQPGGIFFHKLVTFVVVVESSLVANGTWPIFCLPWWEHFMFLSMIWGKHPTLRLDIDRALGDQRGAWGAP